MAGAARLAFGTAVALVREGRYCSGRARWVGGLRRRRSWGAYSQSVLLKIEEWAGLRARRHLHLLAGCGRTNLHIPGALKRSLGHPAPMMLCTPRFALPHAGLKPRPRRSRERGPGRRAATASLASIGHHLLPSPKAPNTKYPSTTVPAAGDSGEERVPINEDSDSCSMPKIRSARPAAVSTQQTAIHPPSPPLPLSLTLHRAGVGRDCNTLRNQVLIIAPQTLVE